MAGRKQVLRWAGWAMAALAVFALGVVLGSRLPGTPPPEPLMAEAPPPAPPDIAEPEPEPPVAAAPDLWPPEVMATPVVTAPPPAGWRRHAAVASDTGGLPMIAIVIDDLGVDRRRSDRIVQLPGPLTTAFMSYATDVEVQASIARAKGHELLLHMPMQPTDEQYDPGPDVVEVGMPAEEVRRRVAQALDRLDGSIGLNNHMGSRFTADPAGMEVVMEELRARGLVFLDSLTTGRSVGLTKAREAGVPAVARDVFLDNDPRAEAVRRQLVKAERVALRHGFAIAIGHPYDGTIEALAEWLPSLADRGLVLVPVSAIIKRQFPSG